MRNCVQVCAKLVWFDMQLNCFPASLATTRTLHTYQGSLAGTGDGIEQDTVKTEHELLMRIHEHVLSQL